ncbi:hypothetical protein L9F63_005766, partial [Diploptera punctata]
ITPTDEILRPSTVLLSPSMVEFMNFEIKLELWLRMNTTVFETTFTATQQCKRRKKYHCYLCILDIILVVMFVCV